MGKDPVAIKEKPCLGNEFGRASTLQVVRGDFGNLCDGKSLKASILVGQHTKHVHF